MAEVERITYQVTTIHPIPGVVGAHVKQEFLAEDWEIDGAGHLIFTDTVEDRTTPVQAAAVAAGQWVSVSEVPARDTVPTMIFPRDMALEALGAIFSRNDPAAAGPKVLRWIEEHCPMEFR